MKSSSLVNTVKSFLAEQRLQMDSTALFVGVSGGMDSMVLMDIVARLSSEFETTPKVLHYNYRVHDHARDAFELVIEEAGARKLPVVAAEALQPDELNDSPEGFEAEARSIRYEFFETVPLKSQPSVVMLAHHRLDQVETTLLNIGRGTGLSGLKGMDPVSTRDNFLLCRPLLTQSSKVIEEYADEHNISYVEDPSNTNVDYARNKIRHEILPAWRDVQPDPDTAIVRLGDRARRENHFWEQFLASNFQDWSWEHELQADREQFRDNHPAAQLRYLRQRVEGLLGSIHGWSERNLQDLRELFVDGRSGAKLDLPGSVRAQNELNRGCLYRTDNEVQFPEERELTGTGEYVFSGLGTLTVLDGSELKANEDRQDVFLGSVSGPLDQFQLRTWNEGDCYDDGNEKRTLKSVFDENNVPYRARRYWPLLVKSETVRCVPGLIDSDSETRSETILIFRPEHPTFHQLVHYND
jgi:tRNA(Ile)-lysidine synthase